MLSYYMILNYVFDLIPRSLGFRKTNDSVKRHVWDKIINNVVSPIIIVTCYATEDADQICNSFYYNLHQS
jgi:hypothetical protein